MKKILYILLFVSVLVIYKFVENYFNNYVDSDNPCVTREKIEKQSKEYRKIVGNYLGIYERLSDVFFEDITQNGKYRMYIVSGNSKKYINNEITLRGQGFPIDFMEKKTKNTEEGQRLHLIVEDNKSGKEVFRMKRYQIYPYKKLTNLSYTGTASTIVQFRCELERAAKE